MWIGCWKFIILLKEGWFWSYCNIQYYWWFYNLSTVIKRPRLRKKRKRNHHLLLPRLPSQLLNLLQCQLLQLLPLIQYHCQSLPKPHKYWPWCLKIHKNCFSQLQLKYSIFNIVSSREDDIYVTKGAFFILRGSEWILKAFERQT